MTHALTLVAAQKPLANAHIKTAQKIIAHYELKIEGTNWLAKNKAADIILPHKPQTALLAHLRDEFYKDGIDVFTLPAEGRRKKLLLADMDSTIVSTETLDELAGFSGIKDQIAAITQKAMEGKLDFQAALKERVALLKDLPADTLDKTLAETVLNPGAKQLVATMKKQGATCVLVSGGFTFFTAAIAGQTGFDRHHGNVLETANGKLAGTVAAPILDKFAKLDFLKSYVKELGLTAEDAMTVGDGANDLPMLKAAGFGVGYRPKPLLAENLDNLIIHGDLASALFAQGYSDSEFA